MERIKNKILINKKISSNMIITTVREEYYRLHYETIMSGDFIKWYRVYCHNMYTLLANDNYI